MRVLVTGGAGFIGSFLCERFIERGYEVVCLDNFNSYYDPTIKHRNIGTVLGHRNYRLVEGDILDKKLLQDLFKNTPFDAVVHLAARAGVRPSIQKPHLYQKVNVEGTLNLLEMSSQFQVSKFIFASSSSVYGKNTKVPFSEDDPVNRPISPYGSTKRAGELLAYTYSDLYSIPVTCLRFFTVYGPRQRPDMAIHKFTQLIVEGRNISVFGDGTSCRDYTYITDIIDGIEKAIQRCEGYHIYNFGESRRVKLRRMIDLLEKEIGKKARVDYLPNQLGDVFVTLADISKAKKELDYSPHVSIEEGICEFVQWYREIECL